MVHDAKDRNPETSTLVPSMPIQLSYFTASNKKRRRRRNCSFYNARLERGGFRAVTCQLTSGAAGEVTALKPLSHDLDLKKANVFPMVEAVK